MLNKKFVKKNFVLSTTLMVMLLFFISACGNNDSNSKSNEQTSPTTTLSLEESMEKESIRKESLESLKESINESKKVEDESIAESVSLHVAEVEEIISDEKDYRETREEYMRSQRESLKNIDINEILKQHEESVARAKEIAEEEAANEN